MDNIMISYISLFRDKREGDKLYDIGNGRTVSAQQTNEACFKCVSELLSENGEKSA